MPEEPSNQEPQHEPTSQDTDARDEEMVSTMGAFPMPVMQRAYSAANLSELGERLQQMAPDPSVFEEEGNTPYFWPAAISTTALDSYFTHMHQSTLRNFAAESDLGVSFLNSHRSGGWSKQAELGFGRSLRGRFVGASAGKPARTVTDFYTIPNLSLNDVNTDDLIRGLRSGLVHDVSVGFSLGSDGLYRCDMCGEDYINGDCKHWLGTDWVGWDGTTEDGKICTCSIENGHLSEVSAVYDGATPGAGVFRAQQADSARALTKATLALEAGTLSADRCALVNQRYRINLASAPRITPVTLNISTPDAKSFSRSSGQIADEIARQLSLHARREEGSMPDEPTTRNPEGQEPPNPPPAADPPAETRTDGAAATTPPAYTAPRPEPTPEERAVETPPAEWTPEQYETVVRSVCAGAEVPLPHAAECVRRLCAEVGEIRPLAVDGRAYREALVGDVLHQAARSQGKAYDEALERELCVGRTTAQLVQMHNRYKAIADALFTSGRVTRDEDEPAPARQEPVTAPQSAYRV